MSKEAFRDRFGDDPRKDDLTVLAPKQDDPTDQVPSHSTLCLWNCKWQGCFHADFAVDCSHCLQVCCLEQ